MTDRNFTRYKQNAWDNLNRRVRTRASYVAKNIQVRMTRTEFFHWCDYQRSYIESFYESKKQPSINRKNHLGHYELSNIEIQDFYENTAEAAPRRRASRIKPVWVTTPDGEEKYFTSIQEAASHYGLKANSIAGVYRGERVSLYGYKFRRP